MSQPTTIKQKIIKKKTVGSNLLYSKKTHSKKLHPRNLHNCGYDFESLSQSFPPLYDHIKNNEHDNLSIDFSDPLAVITLNTALLKHHYGIVDWHIPDGALCPPIPGRVDYIHYVADLLDIPLRNKSTDMKSASSVPPVRLLDVGTGANGIYALLACQVYGWQSVGSDISVESLENVQSIIAVNPHLKDSLALRLQPNKHHIFDGIIQKNEYFDISVCNPPFHSSLEEALKGNQRKVKNLSRNKGKKAVVDSSSLNFGGAENELWCTGGEQLFLKKLIKESQQFSEQCRWFTSLLSKAESIKPAKKLLKKLGAVDIREIEMAQGNKITRILAWTYLRNL